MRVLVCGGRNYTDMGKVAAVLGKLHKEAGIDAVIQGGANGADHLAAMWAAGEGVSSQTYEADWESYGSFAGPKRNAEMLAHSQPDLVIAFEGGRGTADMVKKARKAGVEVIEIAP